MADDCGFPINPLNVEGQLESQAVQGIGDALFEEIITENGRIANPTLTDYRIPGVFDTPEEIAMVHAITDEPKGPFGGKEVGECARAAVMPAIANAVCDAIGVRVCSLPVTPEKVLELLKHKGG